jgi:hypothetical protein
LNRTNWRSASRAAAVAIAATAAYGVSTAVAQTGTPAQTTPTATTPAPTPAPNVGPDLPTNGTEGQPNAGTNTCFTRLFKPKASSVPDELKADDDVVLQYRIRCSSPMSAFTIAFDRQVDGIEAEIPVTFFKGNGVTPDQSFNCGGDLPGLGVSCVGTYKGGYNTVRGLVAVALSSSEQKAGTTSLCQLGIHANISSFYSEVSKDLFKGTVKTNKDGTSQIVNYASGPYRVTTPQCHKGAKAS